MKVAVCGPRGNTVQVQIVSELENLVTSSGNELAAMSDGAASLFLAWIDYLVPEGHQIREVRNIATTLPVPIPPPLVRVLAAGMKATGVRFEDENKRIITPGDVHPEAMNVPTGYDLSLPAPAAVCELQSSPLNPTDPGVAFNAGLACQQGLTLITLSLLGCESPFPSDEHFTSMDDLEKKLKEVSKQ